MSNGSRNDQPPIAQLTQLLWGYRVSQALYVAARLGVFDVVRDEPKSARQIADAVGANESALGRLLRALTSVEALIEDSAGRFANTAMGELLRADHPHSVRMPAIMQCEPSRWQAWGDLYGTILTGEPAFERIHGESLFDYLQQRPDEAAVFYGAMTSGSRNLLPAVLDAYDFSSFNKIVDVAGGEGILLQGILERYPQARGILCDLPGVLEKTDELRASAVADRREFVGMDMFQSVPAGGDAYILKYIVHDWNDAESVQILRNCRQAMNDQGKVLVIERVVKPSNQPDPAKWQDLHMMALLTGRERTEEEFRRLYAQAGFTLTRVIPVGELSILEGAPV